MTIGAGLRFGAFALALMPAFGLSQEATTQLYKAARTHFLQVDTIEVNAHSNRPVLIKGRLAEGINLHDAGQATGLMQALGPLFGLEAARDDFRVKKILSDRLGMAHARLQHLHRGIPVLGSEIILHADASGTLRTINGQLVDRLEVTTAPAIAAGRALELALQHLGPASYRWESASQEAFLKEVYKDASRTWRPQPTLVIAPKGGDFLSGDFRLAWQMLIAVEAPVPANWVYFVDARTGEIINVFNKMHGITGTGATLYGGPVRIEANFSGSTYQMHDVSRNIKTYNGDNGTALPGKLAADGDNNWPQDALVDAHWGVAQVYDYYFQVHGRDSFDNAGAQMTSTAHYRANYVNAAWNGSQVYFGDGNGIDSGPLVALDVAGHEFTHAVTDYEADLIYQGESGALNEAWADIFGTVIEFYATPGKADWLIGEDCWTPDITGDGLRNMQDPNATGQPDTYGGVYWANPNNWWVDNGGVHTNSGVANLAFYLLSQGGSGANDKGDLYRVTGIGMVKARDIFYRAQTSYLFPSSQFAHARTATENAAIDLFGSGSPEHAQVQNAWYAVGVGSSGDDSSGGINLVLNKPALALTTNGSNTPNKAVDGRAGSYWRSGSVSRDNPIAWLRVDLGSEQTVGRASVEWRKSYYALQYQFQVSNDGITWITVYTNHSGAGGVEEFSFPETTARYVRLHMTKNKKPSYRINDLRVYSEGIPFAEPKPENIAGTTIPHVIALHQNYPNPFNPSTSIRFGLPKESHVTIKVYNLRGAEVATLLNARRNAGLHSVIFQPQNLPSGIYFYVMNAGEARLVRRMLLMK
jgi:Zn-dependent metalloprotease